MGARQFAFIRAINTGGRRLTNDQVIAPFVQLGLDDVAAYQAAGNVAFRSDEPPVALLPRLEAAMTDAYGFEAPTFLRMRAQLERVVAATPFSAAELAATEGRVQVAFLGRAPAEATVAEVDALVPREDCAAVVDDQWLWLPRAGISTSEMPVAKVEQLFGPMTIRTLGTIERMLKKFSS